jgi:hypothetical protein
MKIISTIPKAAAAAAMTVAAKSRSNRRASPLPCHGIGEPVSGFAEPIAEISVFSFH